MKNLKNNKGITLVALIITIIVLLILAIVAISAVNGDGIISKANLARVNYQAAQEEENSALAGYQTILDNVNNEEKNENNNEFPDQYLGLAYLNNENVVYFEKRDGNLYKVELEYKHKWEKFDADVILSIISLEECKTQIEQSGYYNNELDDESKFANIVLLDSSDSFGAKEYSIFNKDFTKCYNSMLVTNEPKESENGFYFDEDDFFELKTKEYLDVSTIQ